MRSPRSAGWVFVGAVAVSAVLAGTATAQAPDTPAPPSPCALGDSLLTAGEAKRARAAYVTVLQEDPAAACARDGLAKANGVDPESKAAADSAATDLAPKEARALCASGKAKESAGDDEAAKKDYLKALDADPEAKCKDDLAGLSSTDRRSAAGDAADAALDWIGVAAKWLAAVVAVGLLLVAMLLLALSTVLRPFARRLERWPLVGPLLRPRLELALVDDGALGDGGKGTGAALTARIRERLHRHHEQARLKPGVEQDLDVGALGDRFADLAGADAALDRAVAEASGIHDHAKFAAAAVKLLTAVLPRRRFVVSGVIDPPRGDAMSTTVSVEDGGKVPAMAQVRGQASAVPPTSHDYLALADPIAIWIQYEVARLLGEPGALDPDAPESFALAREALDQQSARRYGEALALYEQAVILYPRNWAAWLGQAGMYARLGRFERSIDTLARAKAAIEADETVDEQGSADYYRLGYQHLAQRLNRAFTSDEHSAEERHSALVRGEADAAAFVRQVDEARDRLRPRVLARAPRWWRQPVDWARYRRGASDRKRATALLPFLDRVVDPCAKIVLGGYRACLGELSEARATVSDLGATPPERLSYRAWYDLACFEATIAAAGDGDALATAVEHLRRAFAAATGRRRHELVEWSRRDPSLAGLRDDDTHGITFRRLLHEFAPARATGWR